MLSCVHFARDFAKSFVNWACRKISLSETQWNHLWNGLAEDAAPSWRYSMVMEMIFLFRNILIWAALFQRILSMKDDQLGNRSTKCPDDHDLKSKEPEPGFPWRFGRTALRNRKGETSLLVSYLIIKSWSIYSSKEWCQLRVYVKQPWCWNIENLKNMNLFGFLCLLSLAVLPQNNNSPLPDVDVSLSLLNGLIEK